MKADEDKLPPRPPEMLFDIIRKFYRGAVSHYPLIQEKQQEAIDAYNQMRMTGDSTSYRHALSVLFHEYHFYTTCWRQVEMALYRLGKGKQTSSLMHVRKRYETEIKQHLHVRQQLEDIEQCVAKQLTNRDDRSDHCYWFEDICFHVDNRSIDALHQLYQEVVRERE